MQVLVRTTVLASLAVALAILAACGDVSSPGSEPAGPAVATGMGPGISMQEALDSVLAGPLLVNGFVVIDPSGAKLCATLAESMPPQCGAPSLRVEGLDPATLEGTSSQGGVVWTPQPVQLLGEVQDGVFTVSGTSIGQAISI